MTATTKSERIDAARKALRWHDDPMATPNADRLADALRALVEAHGSTDRRILTVPEAGWRVAVDGPQETYEAIGDLLTDYTFDQMKWEDQL